MRAKHVEKRNDARFAKQNVAALSDKELNQRINRLEKEKRLKQLTDENYNEAEAYLKDILKTSGKDVARLVVDIGVRSMLNKKFGNEGKKKKK